MSCSVGPIQRGRPKFGECVYCWDENWGRRKHFYFEPRQHMIEPVCGHLLEKPRRTAKQFQMNRTRNAIRAQRAEEGTLTYWYRRAMLPDYCGEPGELRPDFVPPFPSFYEDKGRNDACLMRPAHQPQGHRARGRPAGAPCSHGAGLVDLPLRQALLQ
jgi:hypothetical protein